MGILVNPSVSPRIITVPEADGDSITIQSLHDQCKQWEELPANLSYPILILSAGKEDLGGGVAVGITATLQNAKLAFEARNGPSFVQCNVNGGNLVAVDVNGNLMDPIQTTDFTQVVIAQSTSAVVITQATLEKLLRNKMMTDPTTGIMTVYDNDDTTVLFTSQLYEDIDGVQTYRGRGAERRERLT